MIASEPTRRGKIALPPSNYVIRLQASVIVTAFDVGDRGRVTTLYSCSGAHLSRDAGSWTSRFIMTIHKLCNDKESVVADMLQGVVALNSNACILDGLDQVSTTCDQSWP